MNARQGTVSDVRVTCTLSAWMAAVVMKRGDFLLPSGDEAFAYRWVHDGATAGVS